MRLNRLLVLSAAGVALTLFGSTAPAFAAPAAPAHPYEAIAGHYATMQQADAVAAQAKAKGFRTVIQVNGPKRIEVEYGNDYATPAPALALCKQVTAKGLPCHLGQEMHGVPAAWKHS
jgi:hypothetical protein